MAESKSKKTSSAPKILSKEDILGADDLKRELVNIEEWDGPIYVHTLTGGERDNWEQEIMRSRSKSGRIDIRNLKVRLIVQCVKNADGVLIFNPSDIPALQKKNAKPLDRIYQVAARLSGLSEDEVEELSGN